MGSLAGRDLISIADLSAAEITEVLDVASALKAGADPGRPLAGRNLAMIFQRPSNRTRVSFEVAVRHLGGHPIPLFNSEIQIGERSFRPAISAAYSVPVVLGRMCSFFCCPSTPGI